MNFHKIQRRLASASANGWMICTVHFGRRTELRKTQACLLSLILWSNITTESIPAASVLRRRVLNLHLHIVSPTHEQSLVERGASPDLGYISMKCSREIGDNKEIFWDYCAVSTLQSYDGV